MTLVETIANYASATKSQVSEDAEETFQALYDRTARPLWAYLARASGSRDLADDLLQETYCRFLLRYPPGTGKERSFDETAIRSYLFRIATNVLNDRWRRRKNNGEVDIEEKEAGDLFFVEADMTDRIDVRRVMSSLKRRQRQLLWLAYVEGMNHTEIAAVTGLRALSVKLLLFRARRSAAALLRPQGNEKR